MVARLFITDVYCTNDDIPNQHDSGTEVDTQRQLARRLKTRHMQMIAIGGSIGVGLVVGSGSALYNGGPGSLVIDFMIIGAMLLFTLNALAEPAVM
jgi:amino acid transporter